MSKIFSNIEVWVDLSFSSAVQCGCRDSNADLSLVISINFRVGKVQSQKPSSNLFFFLLA